MGVRVHPLSSRPDFLLGQHPASRGGPLWRLGICHQGVPDEKGYAARYPRGDLPPHHHRPGALCLRRISLRDQHLLAHRLRRSGATQLRRRPKPALASARAVAYYTYTHRHVIVTRFVKFGRIPLEPRASHRSG